MKVFTTVFLAYPLSADIQRVDQANGFDQDEHDLAGLEQAFRERITSLESSNWIAGEGYDYE
jgi:hypothetical protein